MFGDEEYLDMFIEVYASTMRYLQLPINIRNHSFLVDVHMDSGEWVSHWWGRDGVLQEGGWARCGIEWSGTWPGRCAAGGWVGQAENDVLQ